MKKTILGLSTALLLSSTSLLASDDSKVYVIAKALMITGDSSHGHTGNTGYGIGLDLGYKLPYHLSAELISTYATNSVDGHDASYLTYGAALVYTHHITSEAGVFVKGGYEMEDETIEGYADKSSNGFIYAVGAEYKIAPKYEALVEYEASTIEGPRGASIFAGVKYNF